MRLLWLIDSLAAGGAEALTVSFAAAVVAGGAPVELTVAYLKPLAGNPHAADLERLGVEPVDLGARNLRDVAAYRRLLALVRERRCDLIHAHLAYAATWGCLAGRRTGVPVIASLHVRPPSDDAWSREALRRRLLVALASRWAKRVAAVSEAVRDAWVGEQRLDPRRVAVVPNGVDLPVPAGGFAAARRRVRGELGVADGAPLALTVSVLRPGKGIGVLLAAVPAVLARHPEARFAIAGDGPERGEVDGWVAASPPLAAAVHPLGYRRDVSALLAAADLFVLPSLDDAFPTVLLEAMAAGLPVVASRTGGVSEIVEDGVSGLLVPPGDAAALAAAVSALAADPEARRRWGEAGRARHRERFTTAAWLARLETLYAEVLGRPVRLSGPAGGGGGAR